jgi:type IV secretion system protein VirD4
MSRPVSDQLPDQGLLVGWSLESLPRRKVYGFQNNVELQQPSKFLEPVLQSGEGHLITVASTGTGKGVSAIIPALLRYSGPVIVIDPKGENYAVTARRRREMGQNVVVLDPFEITGASRLDRATLNPLDYITPSEDSFVEDVEMIANILAGEEMETAREPFWPHMGYQLIVFVLLYQFRSLPQDKWNLVETRRIIGQGIGGLEELGKEILDGNDELLKAHAGLVVNPAESTIGGYWSHAVSMLSFLKGSLLEKSLAKSTFAIGDIVENKPLSIYLVIPPEKLKSHYRLIRLWMSIFISAITLRTVKPKIPTLMLLDEAAQIGYMPQVEDAITLLRGYGVKVWSFWQDLSQLQRLYPDSWQTILNNCSVQQFFGQATALAARSVHDVTGFGTASQIRNLDRGEMILSIHGDEPVIAQKPNYLEDTPFEGLAEANPFYADVIEGSGIGRSGRVFRRPGEVAAFNIDPLQVLQDHPAKGVLRRLESHPISAERWQEVREVDKIVVLDRLQKTYWMPHLSDGENVSLRRWAPPFYEKAWHYEIRVDWGDEIRFGYCLNTPDRVHPLTGSLREIYEINEACKLSLDPSDVADYLAFFCSSYISENGRFFLVDQFDELVLLEDVDNDYRKAIEAELSNPIISQIEPRTPNGVRKYNCIAPILVGDTLSRANFEVYANGIVNVKNVEFLFADIPTVENRTLEAARLVWREIQE